MLVIWSFNFVYVSDNNRLAGDLYAELSIDYTTSNFNNQLAILHKLS